MRTICECSLKSKFQSMLPFELISSPIETPCTLVSLTAKSFHLKRSIGLIGLLRSFFSTLKVSKQFDDHPQDFAHFVIISGAENQSSLNTPVPLLMRYPEFLSKYTLLPKKVIGKGSYGTIHLASSKLDPTRLFAVKIFNKCRSKIVNESYLSHLSSEFLIGVSLHHKNIVETYELVKCGPLWLEIMEYCTGGDLFHSIHRRLPQSIANIFFIELLSGIHYLHALGIAHCDLKPENILITSDNHVKIADFGASCYFSKVNKRLEHDTLIEETLCQGIYGSLPYTPPEVLCFSPYDPAPVDIWALGIIYFVMTFHRVPWREASELKDERYKKYISQRVKFDPIYRLPAPMSRLLCQMLEPDPTLRITIDQLVNDTYIQNLSKNK